MLAGEQHVDGQLWFGKRKVWSRQLNDDCLTLTSRIALAEAATSLPNPTVVEQLAGPSASKLQTPCEHQIQALPSLFRTERQGDVARGHHKPWSPAPNDAMGAAYGLPLTSSWPMNGQIRALAASSESTAEFAVRT